MEATMWSRGAIVYDTMAILTLFRVHSTSSLARGMKFVDLLPFDTGYPYWAEFYSKLKGLALPNVQVTICAFSIEKNPVFCGQNGSLGCI